MIRGTNKIIFLYLLKFLGAFCILFYGTEAIIGLSSRENCYNPFVANHLNFIDPFRKTLLLSSKTLLALFHYNTYLQDKYTLKLVDGSGIRMVYSCIGYGVISFWLAFVFANKGTFRKKALWMIGGILLLCVINILRISLLVIATNKGWPIPLGWDHHTWFNIAAYILIFCMIYFYDKSGRKEKMTLQGKDELPVNVIEER